MKWLACSPVGNLWKLWEQTLKSLLWKLVCLYGRSGTQQMGF